MPLPKSLTSLLTAIVVAIPAAITTLALNKPKPPKEIDEVITLEENTEVIVEDEINPDPEPAPQAPPQQKPSGTSTSGPLSPSRDSSEDTESSSGLSDLQESSADPKDDEDVEEEDLEDEDEAAEEEKSENQEQEDQTDNEEDEGDKDSGNEPTDDQTDTSVEDLKKSIEELIKKIIEEGNNFNAQDSRLYKLYIIQTSLDSLPRLITSLKDQMEKEKNKSAQEGSVEPGSSSESVGQSK